MRPFWEVNLDGQFADLIGDLRSQLLVLIAIVADPESGLGLNIKRDGWQHNFTSVEEDLSLSSLATQLYRQVRLFVLVIQVKRNFIAVLNGIMRVESHSDDSRRPWLEHAFIRVHGEGCAFELLLVDSPLDHGLLGVRDLDVLMERQRLLTLGDYFCLEVDDSRFQEELGLLTDGKDFSHKSINMGRPLEDRKRKRELFRLVRFCWSVPETELEAFGVRSDAELEVPHRLFIKLVIIVLRLIIS